MNRKRKELIISVTGVLLLLLSAVFCYQTVRDAIIDNEKESIQNIAEVSSHSLKATLQGKSNCKTGKQIPARRQEKIQDMLLQDQ